MNEPIKDTKAMTWIQKNYIENSDLYKYSLENPNNDDLSQIINSMHSPILGFCDNPYLYGCYQLIFDENMTSVIHDIISRTNNDMDKKVICLVAINKNRYNILEALLSNGFNFNQCIDSQSLNYLFAGTNILTLAYMYNGDIKMIKYLLENGADISYKKYILLDEVCKKNDIDTMNYLLDLDTHQDALFVAIQSSIKYDHIDMIKNIMANNDFDLAPYSKILHITIARVSVEIVQYLLDHGLVLDCPEPLLFACYFNNIDLIDFYLDYGLHVNKEILDYVFEEMNMVILKLFTKHKVDFSVVECPKMSHENLPADLEINGLNKNIFMHLLLNYSETRFYHATDLKYYNKMLEYSDDKNFSK